MRVWTIQPHRVWEHLQREGILWVEPTRRHAEASFALRWLVGKLQVHIPAYSGHLPWWAYREKPDLRIFRHRLYGPQVRIELDLPSKTYLAFPGWAWHRVLTWEPLSDGVPNPKKDEDAAEPPGSLVESWDRLFDSDLPPKASDIVLGDIAGYEIVFEQLNRENVVRTTSFNGINRQLRQILEPEEATFI